MSAFSKYASHPPVVYVWDGYQWRGFAYVTINHYKLPRLDAAYLMAYLRVKGGCSAP